MCDVFYEVLLGFTTFKVDQRLVLPLAYWSLIEFGLEERFSDSVTRKLDEMRFLGIQKSILIAEYQFIV